MGNPIARQWDRLHKLPMGRQLFSLLLGRMVPYTGTIHPEVLELKKGYAKVSMRDRPGVRNHLNSIHAIALMNLGEVVTGLAFVYSLPDDARAIVTNLSIEYKKKARGRLTAECTCEIPSSSEKRSYQLTGAIRDEQGDVVAVVTASWLSGPARA